MQRVPFAIPAGHRLLVAVYLCIFGASACQDAPVESQTDAGLDPPSQPNIVFVLVDDLRWDELGAAGHPYIQTPNIDRIASSGAYFQNSFTTTPLCSPSRASFLTGQYAHANGITDNLARNEQSHRLETFPKKLDAQGYDTAFIGKWHMGNDDTPRPGFDTWAVMKGQGEASNPEFNLNGERKQLNGSVTDILTGMATDFIKKPRTEPFLLYVSHKGLHPKITQLDDGSSVSSPSGIPGFIAAERHDGMYADSVQPRRENFGIPPLDKPALLQKIGDLPPLGLDTVTPDATIQDRQEMLMAIDDGVGAMLDALSEIGKLDDTIVVFASDHGYWYGEHGLGAERRLAYEEGIRIPLMISYPRRITPSIRPVETVLSIDLAPTMLEFAGAPLDNSLQGRSLVPVLDGTAEGWRDSFLIEYYSDTVFQRIQDMGYKAVRNNRYKYIQYVDLDGMDELYDLQNDPYELKNIIDDKDAAPALQAMQSELQRLLAESGS
jgi:N-acetylglucosamine-6-sulfatase